MKKMLKERELDKINCPDWAFKIYLTTFSIKPLSECIDLDEFEYDEENKSSMESQLVAEFLGFA